MLFNTPLYSLLKARISKFFSSTSQHTPWGEMNLHVDSCQINHSVMGWRQLSRWRLLVKELVWILSNLCTRNNQISLKRTKEGPQWSVQTKGLFCECCVKRAEWQPCSDLITEMTYIKPRPNSTELLREMISRDLAAHQDVNRFGCFWQCCSSRDRTRVWVCVKSKTKSIFNALVLVMDMGVFHTFYQGMSPVKHLFATVKYHWT